MKLTMKQHGFRIELPHQTLDIDGNEQFGIRPYQLMVSSIAGCSASVFRKIMEKQRLEIDDMEVSAEVERDELAANRITKITLTFVIRGFHLDKGQLEKNLQLAHNNCSMVQSVKDSIEIEERLEVIHLNHY
ncbi:osmotically inducible protein C [Virgibacillus sp. 7505]|uniref:OsmC family protein n=1 Tax=Virgibacillus sp. 7505 TaxID=2022548 RepID=UPI000BA5FD8A|nr:OsmC family protein [Virgibacillus sp. 7505]PAE16214.1 osmotically inducible protein C [Virgibacillus sp. 7505]